MTEPVDLKRLNTLTYGNRSLIEKALRMYVREIAERLERLKTALSAGIMTQVKDEAHGCLGSSLTYGVTALIGPLRELERLAREGKLQEVASCYEHVCQEFETVRSFVENEFK